ncbi:hypothetical protein [Streptomyces halstedii]|uniref:Uncharacterized protein n=1 Tax=Streptomyces halstedii TaxID=1944 RepID=A0A6N9U5T9_STRHA|nr:hypothetical protein [Streptomyces halstedii]NEA19180.1 hypothetical protein [Streptomyces halstedii]
MRDSISRALMWMLRLMLPARGKRRAATVPVPTPEPAPAVVPRMFAGPSSGQARAIFRAEETRGLTPEQRERWWAAAFAEIGVD